MKKIDDKVHQRFITALEKMIRDMDTFGYSATADDLEISRDELEDTYRKYSRKIEEVNSLIQSYYSLFSQKHSEYLNASRLRQKEQTRIRHKKV